LTLVIIILAWTIGLLWIESAGYPEVSSTTGFVTYVKNEMLAIMILFHLFGFLWLLQFVIACQHMVRFIRN
jgi:solute carrier family 44 protein 1 (choline transporter-like protein)